MEEDMPKESNKEKNHIMWEQVRKQADPMSAIKLTADVGEEAINSSIEDRSRLDLKIDECIEKLGKDIKAELAKVIDKIDKVNLKLSGNGDPSHSIIARLEDLEETVAGLKATLKWIGVVAGGWMIIQLIQIIIKALAAI
jgi:hypothetical protein